MDVLRRDNGKNFDGEQAVLRIREQIFESYDPSVDLSDEELLVRISHQVKRYAADHILSLKERTDMERQVFHSFRRMDVLQELLDRPEITEVLVNGPLCPLRRAFPRP